MGKEILKASEALNVAQTQGFEFLKNQIAKYIKQAAERGETSLTWVFNCASDDDLIMELIKFFEGLGYSTIAFTMENNRVEEIEFNWGRKELDEQLSFEFYKDMSLTVGIVGLKNVYDHIKNEIVSAARKGLIRTYINIKDVDPMILERIMRLEKIGFQLKKDEDTLVVSWEKGALEVKEELKKQGLIK